MKILITGSSGQIGTNLGLHLLDLGHEVYGIDIRPNTWTDKIPTQLLDLSKLDPNLGDEFFSKFPDDLDIVVHFAAHAKVHQLVIDPFRAIENITMTFNVLEFCRAKNLPIIFSSSREVYGDVVRDLTAEDTADFAVAESPYSASKISGEALVYSYSRCYNLNYLVFRFSNVYGRYDNDIDRMERVIPLFIAKIAKGEPITVFGEEKVLDFTYVDDCVSGIYAGIERLMAGDVKNETINLAFGQGNSLINMTQYIANALGYEADMTIKPSLVGEVTHYVADIQKARNLLGYNPETSLEDGIKKTVAWSQAWAKS